MAEAGAAVQAQPLLHTSFLIGKKSTKKVIDEEAYAEFMGIWQKQLEQNWQNGYTQMPDEVAADPDLSPRAKHVYRALLSFMWRKSDRCWPSQETLAERTGYSVRTVIRALNDLYERGYIEKWRRGQGDTNYYFINPLSFVKSFRAPGRGHGVRLQVRALHEVTMANTPAPLLPLCGPCQVVTSEHDTLTEQGMPNCQTNQTNQKQMKKSSISSNLSTTASGEDVGGTAIRKANDEPISTMPTTQPGTKGTNPSPIPTTQPKTNQTEKLSDELAAPRRAKEALLSKMGKPHGGAAQIALATGIPAEHLAELGVAPERKKQPVPDFIQNVIKDFSVELGDNPRSYKSSVTRATKIYYTALAIFTDIQDDPEGHFLRAMYDARTAAKQVTNIRHQTGPRANRMPAFFTCWENQYSFQPHELEWLRSDEPLYYPARDQ